MNGKYVYHTCCVQSDAESIQDMVDQAREISLATFRRHCDCEDWERDMGYARGREAGIHLKNDYHVSFHRSRFRGHPCCFAVHSAIEYVFIDREAAQTEDAR